jgi:hypothetical protein
MCNNPGLKARLLDIISKKRGDHPMTISAIYCLDWFSGFKGTDLNVKSYRHADDGQTPIGKG